MPLSGMFSRSRTTSAASSSRSRVSASSRAGSAATPKARTMTKSLVCRDMVPPGSSIRPFLAVGIDADRAEPLLPRAAGQNMAGFARIQVFRRSRPVLLGRRSTVGHVALDHVIGVRIPTSQPILPPNLGRAAAPRRRVDSPPGSRNRRPPSFRLSAIALYGKVLCVSVRRVASPGTASSGPIPGDHVMQVLRARHMGMCFGVRRAIARAVAAAERQPLTILGELVHNETVLADLRARGIRTCTEVDDVDTETVMITAHGVSERRLAQLRARHLCVLNATCPLVRSAHRAVAMLVSSGCHPVIVGQPGHAEVLGLTEDLDACDVVLKRRGRARTPGTAPIRHRRPDHAADRARAPCRCAHPPALPPVGHRDDEHRVPSNPSPAGVSRGAGAPGRRRPGRRRSLQQQHARTGGHLPPAVRARASRAVSGGRARRLAQGRGGDRHHGRNLHPRQHHRRRRTQGEGAGNEPGGCVISRRGPRKPRHIR